MATLAVALARGLRAAQPLATDVPNGNLYFVTDEGVTEQSDGSAWVSYSGSGGAGTVTHTGALTASRVVVGNGTADLKVLGSLGTTTTLLHGNAAGLPTFAAVDLTADVSGVLPVVNGGTGSTAGAAILKATKTIANAGIKTLPSTPVTLVAAPGAGFRIRPLAVSLVMRATAGNYSGVDTTYAALTISYTDLSGEWLSGPILNDSSTNPNATRLTDFFGATDLVIDMIMPGAEAFLNDAGSATQWVLPYIATVLTGVEDKALVLALDNGSATDLGGGHAANSLFVTTYYTVEALS